MCSCIWYKTHIAAVFVALFSHTRAVRNPASEVSIWKKDFDYLHHINIHFLVTLLTSWQFNRTTHLKTSRTSIRILDLNPTPSISLRCCSSRSYRLPTRKVTHSIHKQAQAHLSSNLYDRKRQLKYVFPHKYWVSITFGTPNSGLHHTHTQPPHTHTVWWTTWHSAHALLTLQPEGGAIYQNTSKKTLHCAMIRAHVYPPIAPTEAGIHHR